MAEMRAKDAFPLETNLLGDALRGEVLGIGDQLEALELQLVECPTAQ